MVRKSREPDEPDAPAHHSPAGEAGAIAARAEGGVFVPRQVYVLLTVMAVLLMAMLWFTSPEEVEVENPSPEGYEGQMSWMVDALFADGERDVVLGWPCRPLTVVASRETSPDMVGNARDTLAELNEMTGSSFRLIREAEWQAGDDDCAKLFLSVSDEGVSTFEDFYTRIFTAHHDNEAYEFWAARGAFEFEFAPQTPCLGFGVYETQNYFTEGFTRQNAPGFGMISIGNARQLPAGLLRQCFREELAHLIFFIPDRYVEQGRDSIFNANFLIDETDEYSERDRELMRFLADNPDVIGLDREAFALALSARAQ